MDFTALEMFKPHLVPGQSAWCMTREGLGLKLLTIGRTTIEVVDSPGVNGGCVEDEAPGVAFDNYKAQKSREETYMMVETGIGSGHVYTYGETAFKTKAEALAAIVNITQTP